jgi:hypothetical protein
LRADFTAKPDDGAKLLRVGTSPVDETLPVAAHAAAMSVASMILSLDETISKN